MSSERMEKLLIFEGLSCCGKTYLIERLTRESECVGIIRRISRDLQSPTPEVFMKNDELKFSDAKKCRGIALMDRGYLSTLVFYTVMEEMCQGFSAEPVKSWVAYSMGKTLFKPDYYVFVEIPPQVSRERATGVRPFDSRNLWMTATERMHFWYGEYLSTLEEGVPILRVDGIKPLDLLEKELEALMISLKDQK